MAVWGRLYERLLDERLHPPPPVSLEARRLWCRKYLQLLWLRWALLLSAKSLPTRAPIPDGTPPSEAVLRIHLPYHTTLARTAVAIQFRIEDIGDEREGG